MTYLFVHDDSLTSKRFTTRTEQLTKCCEPLQKMRVRLGPCKTGFSSPVVLCYVADRSNHLFYVLETIFVMFEPYVRLHNFSKVRATEWPPIGKLLLSRLRYVL